MHCTQGRTVSQMVGGRGTSIGRHCPIKSDLSEKGMANFRL